MFKIIQFYTNYNLKPWISIIMQNEKTKKKGNACFH